MPPTTTPTKSAHIDGLGQVTAQGLSADRFREAYPADAESFDFLANFVAGGVMGLAVVGFGQGEFVSTIAGQIVEPRLAPEDVESLPAETRCGLVELILQAHPTTARLAHTDAEEH